MIAVCNDDRAWCGLRLATGDFASINQHEPLPFAGQLPFHISASVNLPMPWRGMGPKPSALIRAKCRFGRESSHLLPHN
jgi:hypothetical protein